MYNEVQSRSIPALREPLSSCSTQQRLDPMRAGLTAVASVAAIAIVGCERPTAPEATALDRVPPPSMVAGAELGATGGGHYLLAGVYDVKFSFTAKRRADGSAEGEFRQVTEFENGTADVTGEVTCLGLDPVNHRAWIGGVVKQNNSTSPDYIDPITEPGQDVWFRVVDYGEGEQAVPDRTTFLGFAGAAGFLTSAAYCAGKPWPAEDARTHPVTQGNILVHD